MHVPTAAIDAPESRTGADSIPSDMCMNLKFSKKKAIKTLMNLLIHTAFIAFVSRF
jgi:hypothetical protein